MRTVGAWLVGIWLVTLPVCTYLRGFDWQDEAVLWRQAHAWSPAKIRPVANLGRIAHLRGEDSAAEFWYRHALSLSRSPQRPAFERTIGCVVASRNLALLYTQQSRFTEAVQVPSCE